MSVFNRLKNIKSIRHNGKEIVAAYANNKLVYHNQGADYIDPKYNYFVFDTTLSLSGPISITLQENRAGDTTEWDGLTDWGDGTVDTELSHTYASHGTYTVKTKWVINSKGTGDEHTRKILIKCKNLNKNLTSGFYLFYSCTNLRSIDFSTFDASKSYNLAFMFYCCESLTRLDLSGWDLSNVTDLSRMFCGCYNLETLNTHGWDTSNVTSMNNMFASCTKLITNVSHFNMSKVTNTAYMFYSCKALTEIDVTNWDTSSLERADYMFSECRSLESIDLTGWNTSKLTNVERLFNNCAALKIVDLSGWNTTKMTKFTAMFAVCKDIESIDLSGWDLNHMTNGAFAAQKIFLGTGDAYVDEETGLSRCYIEADELVLTDCDTYTKRSINISLDPIYRV